MLYFFQASTHEALFYALRSSFQQEDVFSAQTLIVPSFGVANDVRRRLCDAQGILWEMEVRFWTMWEWSLIERSHQQSYNYEFAPLGSAAMRWKVFAYLQRHQQAILQQAQHPLHGWLRLLLASSPPNEGVHSQHLWHFASEMARILGLYLNSRSDWLMQWCQRKPPLRDLVQATKLEALPPWLQEHYEALYGAQYFLFKELFALDFEKRERQRLDFYQNLEHLQREHALLPPRLWLYFLEDANPRQMEALQALGKVSDVYVFHLCNSHHYIADLKDQHWLRKRFWLEKDTAALHHDAGHTLFSRFGKIQRAQAQLLLAAEVDIIHLEDEYESASTLLQALQSDMQQLHDEALQALPFNAEDESLRLWGCHGLMQQLEHVRSAIALWLSEDASRHLSDVLLVFPDFDDNLATIRAIFPAQSAYDGYFLPARISGVLGEDAQHLWDSITGFYTLLDGRFDLQSVAAWLLLPETHQAYGLSAEDMQRALELLQEAGFYRGFDEEHLRESLHPDDDDWRFTFCGALDVLLRQMLSAEALLPFAERHLLDVLCQMAWQWKNLRQRLREALPVGFYLAEVQQRLQEQYAFALEYEGYTTLQKALRDLDYVLQQRQHLDENEQKALPLRFVLDWVARDLAQQQTGGEPSGVITISSVRAMRRVPYRFIAFLQAEQERFPRQQQDDHYNLRELDASRLGDRNQEDEDAAVFLDLMTAAQERLWFYYNAVDPQDHERRLPAQPVQEVWQHLQQHRSDWAQFSAAELHPQPFAQKEGAPLWQRVQRALQEKALPREKESFPLPTWTALTPQPWQLQRVLRQLQSPARTFLEAHWLRLPALEKRLPHLEPLHLDALQSYRLRDSFLQEENWEDFLPAGAAGKAWRQQLQHFYGRKKALFLERHRAAQLSILQAQTLDIAGGSITAYLPQEALWLSMSASKESAKHLFKLWLEHLTWSLQGGGVRHHVFEFSTWALQPVPPELARQELSAWLQLAQSMQQALFLLPIELFWQEKKINVSAWAKNLDNAQRDYNIHDARYWRYVLEQRDWQNQMESLLESHRERFYPLFQAYAQREDDGQDES